MKIDTSKRVSKIINHADGNQYEVLEPIKDIEYFQFAYKIANWQKAKRIQVWTYAKKKLSPSDFKLFQEWCITPEASPSYQEIKQIKAEVQKSRRYQTIYRKIS